MSEIHSPIIVEHAAGRTLVFDSATYVEAYVAANPCRDDVIVAASYAGVLCAKSSCGYDFGEPTKASFRAKHGLR